MINALADFRIAIRKSSSGDAHAEVRILAQEMAEPDLGIQISRRDRQPQRDVGVQKIRLVPKIKRVARQRSMAFKGGVVTKLDQFPWKRIHLRIREGRA